MRNTLFLAFALAFAIAVYFPSGAYARGNGGYGGGGRSNPYGIVGNNRSFNQPQIDPSNPYGIVGGGRGIAGNTAGINRSNPYGIVGGGRGSQQYRGNDAGSGIAFVVGAIVGAIAGHQSQPKPRYCPPPPVCYPEPQPQVIVVERPPVECQPTGITGSVTLNFCSGLQSNICIPEAKPVSLGTQIWFVCNGQTTGKFSVTSIYGRTLKLQHIWGCEPGDRAGFAVVYTN